MKLYQRKIDSILGQVKLTAVIHFAELKRLNTRTSIAMADSVRSNHIKLLCCLFAAFLQNFSATMVVPILPDWLDWCDDVIKNATKESEILRSTSNSTSNLLLSKSCSESEFNSLAPVLYALASLAELIIGLMFSSFSDYFHAEFLGFFGLVLAPISLIPFAFGHGYAMYFVTETTSALCTIVAEVVYLVQVDSIFRTTDKGHSIYTGLYTFITDTDIFGPAFSGMASYYFGQRVPFLSLAGISVAVLILYITLGVRCHIELTNTPNDITNQQFFHQETERNNNSEANIQQQSDPLSYKTLLADPQILYLSWLLFCTGTSQPMLATTISLWMMSTFDANEAIVGISYLPGLVTCAIAMFPVNKVMSMWSDKQWILVTFLVLLNGLSLVLIPFSTSIYIFIITFTITITSSVTSRYVLFPLIGTKIEEIYGVRDSSTIRGWEYMVVQLPSVIGPLLSTLFEFWGMKIITVLGVIQVCCSLPLYNLKPSPDTESAKYEIIPNYCNESVVSTEVVEITSCCK